VIPPPRRRLAGRVPGHSTPAARRAKAELRALRADVERLRAASMTDPLTGLLNYRGFHERLEEELSRSRRERYPISVVAIDLDGLKWINDNFGHRVGDEALRTLARSILGCIRPSDICGRLGGDEFVLALPRVQAKEAQRVVDRIHEADGMALPDHSRLGFSAGVATTAGETTDERLLQAADAAMYEAKRRHQGVAASSSALELRESFDRAIGEAQGLVGSALQIQQRVRSERSARAQARSARSSEKGEGVRWVKPQPTERRDGPPRRPTSS
jgi:diguanylate cyclase (GGDEF)-like protein